LKFGIRRRKVAEDELSGAISLSPLPNLDDAGNGKIDLGLLVRRGVGIDEPHVERRCTSATLRNQKVLREG
jgi:hypothetical protein